VIFVGDENSTVFERKLNSGLYSSINKSLIGEQFSLTNKKKGCNVSLKLIIRTNFILNVQGSQKPSFLLKPAGRLFKNLRFDWKSLQDFQINSDRTLKMSQIEEDFASFYEKNNFISIFFAKIKFMS